jgi:hypothetical protein
LLTSGRIGPPAQGKLVRTFHFFIDDARCGDDPQQFTVSARDESRARQLAERMMAESLHHLGVEVWEDGKRLFGLGSLAGRSLRDGPPPQTDPSEGGQHP